MDRILTIDERKRIGIAEIKEHPWFKRPLPPKFKASEDQLFERQHQLDARLENRILDEVRIALQMHCKVALMILGFTGCFMPGISRQACVHLPVHECEQQTQV